MQPEDLVGKEVPAADGGNYGHRILSWDGEDYIVRPIRWSTGEFLGEETMDITAFKLSYRYVPKEARDPLLP